MVNRMTKSDMIPGWSARQWGGPLKPLGTVLIFLTVVSAAAYFLTGATAETVPPWLYVLIALMIATYAAGMFFLFAGLIKAIREAKAGYTTTVGGYPELPQLDSKTGNVLREAGQPAKPANRIK